MAAGSDERGIGRHACSTSSASYSRLMGTTKGGDEKISNNKLQHEMLPRMNYLCGKVSLLCGKVSRIVEPATKKRCSSSERLQCFPHNYYYGARKKNQIFLSKFESENFFLSNRLHQIIRL